MKKTATFIKDNDGPRTEIVQKVYRLDPPMDPHDDGDEPVSVVVVSAAMVPFSGPETYIFPATEDGKVTSWLELEGSRRGTLNHDPVLRGAGYEPVYP